MKVEQENTLVVCAIVLCLVLLRCLPTEGQPSSEICSSTVIGPSVLIGDRVSIGCNNSITGASTIEEAVFIGNLNIIEHSSIRLGKYTLLSTKHC